MRTVIKPYAEAKKIHDELGARVIYTEVELFGCKLEAIRVPSFSQYQEGYILLTSEDVSRALNEGTHHA